VRLYRKGFGYPRARNRDRGALLLVHERFSAVLMIAVAAAFWRTSDGRALPPPQEATTTSERPGPAPQLVAVVCGTAVCVGLVVVLVHGLSGLAISVIEVLAASGERRAQPGAMPFEQLLVPAVDGFAGFSSG
jgi:hypothetical protein